MGFIGGLFIKAATGIKSLVTNAQIGKAATANGYIQGVLSPAQQAQAKTSTGIASWNPLYVIGGIVAFVIAVVVAIFHSPKKRR